MITKFQQSWQIFKASIAVTFENRKLLLFPILSAFLTAVIALFFLVPMATPVVLHHTGYHLNQPQHWLALKDYYFPTVTGSAPGHAAGHQVSPLISFYAVVIYFASMFLATF